MTSQRIESTWIRAGGYGRFRGEWVKHLYGDRAAAILLTMDSVTKLSKYGKSEYSRALNATYTFTPLMSFWLRLIVVSINLEYRERQRQRKRKRRATG